MGNASNEAKQRWNSANYTQVKFSVKPEIAVAFKAHCAGRGVSMASEISRFMADNCGASQSTNRVAVATRPQRRKAVKHISELLDDIIDAETQYMDNIPQNLKNSRNFDLAEQAVAALEEVVELLENAY